MSRAGAAVAACTLVTLLACAPAPVDLPDGHVGQPYGAPVPNAGQARAWAVVAGELPPGLTLEPATGLVRGIPTRAGDFTFTVAPGGGASSAGTRQPLKLRILPGAIGATETPTPAATQWRGTHDYRLFQHVPAGDQISTAHVVIALTEEPDGTLQGTADGSVDATLTLSNCPSHTVSPARFHAELAGSRTSERMELRVVNPSYGPIEITPCPRAGKPGVIGGGKIYGLDEALAALTSTDGQVYRFHSETTHPSGAYPFTVTHTVEVQR